MEKEKFKFMERLNMFEWIYYVLSGKYTKDVNEFNTKNREEE